MDENKLTESRLGFVFDIEVLFLRRSVNHGPVQRRRYFMY